MISKFTIIIQDDDCWDSGVPVELFDDIKAALAKKAYGDSKIIFACYSTMYGFTVNLLTNDVVIYGYKEETSEWAELFKENDNEAVCQE